MKAMICNVLLACVLPVFGMEAVNIGIGKADITPPVGTPSAGYTERQGQGMEGSHDPLQAIALFIDNGKKQIVICSVDHLGYSYEMVQEIIKHVQSQTELKECEVYISSSHTHSGGGAYLDIPWLGEALAGVYDAEITQYYINKTAQAIIQAYKNQEVAKIGLGYGKVSIISKYRGTWPVNGEPLSDVAVMKITKLDDSPLAVLFNFPMHPTVLKSQNMLFSSDFVGYTRDHLKNLLGEQVQPIFINGAQGDIIPVVLDENDRFNSCDQLGKTLAEAVYDIWENTETKDTLVMKTQKESYSFVPKQTPFKLRLPIDHYASELNILVFNDTHAFVTIPGELSCLYDRRLKEFSRKFGYQHLTIFGLTNDAHGYIILPESWQHKTFESALSFGGVDYGTEIETRVQILLHSLSPN